MRCAYTRRYNAATRRTRQSPGNVARYFSLSLRYFGRCQSAGAGRLKRFRLMLSLVTSYALSPSHDTGQ